MKLKVFIHNAGEGGFWAEVPDSGLRRPGETLDEVLGNVPEAIEGCLYGENC
jgi:predicted RNase H-like HicB family nuclease